MSIFMQKKLEFMHQKIYEMPGFFQFQIVHRIWEKSWVLLCSLYLSYFSLESRSKKHPVYCLIQIAHTWNLYINLFARFLVWHFLTHFLPLDVHSQRFLTICSLSLSLHLFLLLYMFISLSLIFYIYFSMSLSPSLFLTFIHIYSSPSLSPSFHLDSYRSLSLPLPLIHFYHSR